MSDDCVFLSAEEITKVRVWARVNGHLYDEVGPVPERIKVNFLSGKTLLMLYNEAHPNDQIAAA